MVGLKSRGSHNLKRGTTGYPSYMSARFTGGVVRLLYCADAFEVQRKCWLELSLVVFRIARPHNTHTRTHTSAVHSCHKTNILKCGDCYSVAATTSKAYGVIQVLQQGAYGSKRKNEQQKLNGTSILETVFLVPTAVGSRNDPHAHTCTLTNPHAEAPFVAVTMGKS